MARVHRGTGEAWLRGGQTFTHTIDMILEVLGKLAIPAIVWGTVCLCTANSKSGEFEQTYGLQALQASTFEKIGYPFPTKLSIRGLDGVDRTYFNTQVPSLKWLQPYAHAYYHNLWLALWLWILGDVVILCVATAWFIDSGEDKLRARFIRGQTTVPVNILTAQIEAFNKAETQRRSDTGFRAVRMIGVPYPYKTEHEHTLTVGSPGSGKSQALHDMLESIRALGGRAVIYDPELEYTKYHYDAATDVVLNPYDARSAGWSPYNDAHDLPDFEKLAACIFKEPKSGDPYWTKATRAVFVFAAYRFKRQFPSATLEDLLRVFFGPMEVLASLLANTPAASHLVGGSNGRTQSLQSVLSEGVGSLVHLVGNTADFSLRQWVNEPTGQPGFLFLSAPETHMTSLRPLISFWSELVVSALLSRLEDGERPTTFLMLDEFPSLGKVESLASGPERLRKYGGAVVLGMQQVSQIQEIYGHEIAQTIIGQCATKLILRCQDPETAKHMAEQLGRRQTRRIDETTSYGASSLRDGVGLTPREDLELVALPDQVMNLPKFHGFIRVSNARDGEPFPISRVRFGFKARPQRAPGLVPLAGPDPVERFFTTLGAGPAAPPPANSTGAPNAPSPADMGPSGEIQAAAANEEPLTPGAQILRAAAAAATGSQVAADAAPRALQPDTDVAANEGATSDSGPNHSSWTEPENELEREARRLSKDSNERPTAYVELLNKVRRDEVANVPLVGVATWRKRTEELAKDSDGSPAPTSGEGPGIDEGRSLSMELFSPEN
jgi:type IV conjugative transfer system coupling protein TraD